MSNPIYLQGLYAAIDYNTIIRLCKVEVGWGGGGDK